MILLAIDPGPIESAWVAYDTDDHLPVEWAKASNAEVRRRVRHQDNELMACEMIASYGMAVGREVFETCLWIGRFCEVWEGLGPDAARLVYRREVKLHLCNSSKAKDANVRQALIDRFGGSKAAAIGLKATPGPLHGLHGDCWSALGVAITAAET